jgi:cell division protein FtsN
MKKPGSRPTPQRQDTAPRKSGGGILLGLFLGLVVGILIAFGIVWYLNKAPLPFLDKTGSAAARDSAKAAQAISGNDPSVPAQPIALAGKPGDKVSEKPRFDFYGILEGKSPVGGSAPPAAAPAPVPTPTPAESSATKAAAKSAETFFLQAGAFQKPDDADNLKAKLAMMGIEANVQVANIPDKGKMHRVRIGPLASADEMNQVRTQLSQGGVQASVVKP